MKISISVVDRNCRTLGSAAADGSASLAYDATYSPGDAILVETDTDDRFVWVRLEDDIPESLIFLRRPGLRFPIPTGDEALAYPPSAFRGARHVLSARRATPADLSGIRDLSLNPLDVRGPSSAYPHCTATAETRGESVFAARNAIDGVIETSSHGSWPFQSWGEDEDPEAEITVDFGRLVVVERIIVNLRADFPHDNFWEKACVRFGSDDAMPVRLRKTGSDQDFRFRSRLARSVTLCHLAKSADPSPFPALTQLRVFGREAP